MGKRNEWTSEIIAQYMEQAGGHLATAARNMSKDSPDREKVTRQNLQTWVNDSGDTGTQEVMDNADLLRINRNLTNTNNKLRREQRGTLDTVLTTAEVLGAISEAVADADPAWPMPYIKKPANGRKITIELLFSDIQIGKLMDDYNTAVALRRVDEYISVVQDRIEAYGAQGYDVENIVLAVLGDIIESDKKHDNSGRACDIGTADQMKVGVEVLFQRVIKGLAYLAPLEVVMITGNHDHDGHGLNMFKPGREHLSWPMYHAVKMLAEAAGIDATFHIPEGSFHIHEIYGTKVLYEHGVGVATSGPAMKKHVGNRIDQLKEYIGLFRMGDKHNISRFNNDRLVVNGAFFGDSRSGEEYSGIVGYDGEPAQLMFAHVKRSDTFRTSIFDSLAIQLGHIK